VKYRLVITPPYEPPDRLVPHGTAKFWIEGFRAPWWGRRPRWLRMTAKKDMALRQPMPKGAVWDLGEHASIPKYLVALRDEDLPA